MKIYKERPLTIVLVTHNIPEAVFLVQKIVIMKNFGIKDILDYSITTRLGIGYFIMDSLSNVNYVDICLVGLLL